MATRLALPCLLGYGANLNADRNLVLRLVSLATESDLNQKRGTILPGDNQSNGVERKTLISHDSVVYDLMKTRLSESKGEETITMLDSRHRAGLVFPLLVPTSTGTETKAESEEMETL